MSSSSSRQSLRPLLPLAPQDPGSSSDQETLVPGLALPQTTVTPANRRRVVARAACIPCRRRKTKCSAERPTCNECLRRRSPDCCYNTTDEDETPGRALKRRYADLESQATAYEQVYDILRTRSESQVDEIVRRIRAGENPGSIIRHVEHGDLLIQLNVVPEARFRYEFPFRITFPSRLLTQANPYLDSQIYEWESRQDHGLSQPQQQSPRLLKDTANVPAESPRKDSPTAQKASTDTGVYLKPYHAAEVYDTLLDSTEPSKWTSVIKDNALLRNLLRTYFLHDYVWFTAFQKDYFLADMIAGRRQFCSSLLVNAVLAIACHGDRSITDRVEFWNPHTLGYRFLNEARRLWEVEVASERIRLTTIQAAILLNYVYNMNSMVQLGWGFTLQAMDWARKINLFKKPNNPDAMDPRFKLGRDFTAWCLFEWQSHCTYFLFQRPLQEDPPETPLPNVVHQPSWYGEVWLRYPLEQNLFPYNFGQFFKAKSELRVILNDISRECYGRSTPNYRPSLEKVGELYTRLYSWYANLPECLLPKNIVFSGQMKLHMHYHHAVITLLHPLVTLGTARAPSPGDEPTSASTRSLGQMPNGTSGGNPLSISAILNSDSDSHNAGGSSSSSPPAPTGDKPCSPGRPPPSPSRCLPSIEAPVTQARIHYETILRLYYLRHGFEGLDPFLTVALITNSFLTIEELDAFGPRQPETQEEKDYLDSLRSTLVLCAKGLFEQGKSYFLAQTLFKLVRDGMDDKDVELLREHIHQQKQDEEAATKNEEMRARLMKGLWPLVSIPEPSNRIIINGDYEQEEEKKEEDASGVWKKMDGMLRKYGGLKLDDEPGGDEDDDGVF